MRRGAQERRKAPGKREKGREKVGGGGREESARRGGGESKVHAHKQVARSLESSLSIAFP